MEGVSLLWKTGLFPVQYNNDNKYNDIWGKGWAVLLAAHYKTLGFPKLGVPQLVQYHLGPAPRSSHRTWGLRETDLIVKLMLPAVPRIIKSFISRNLMSSASSHETWAG